VDQQGNEDKKIGGGSPDFSPQNQLTERDKKTMTIQQLLIDNTNYLWKPTSRDGEYGWFEMETDLDVRARATDKSAKPGIVIYNKDGGERLELTNKQYNYLTVATHYAQFNDGGDMGEGSVEQFWAYARAYDVLGGEPGFGGSSEGIHCHVGDASLFCDYTDGVYDLFDNGCHGYAATADALKSAYDKVLSEMKLWEDFRQRSETAAAEN